MISGGIGGQHEYDFTHNFYQKNSANSTLDLHLLQLVKHLCVRYFSFRELTVNTPLGSNDLGKILAFTLCLLPIIIFFGFGIIPVIFLIFGIFMMKKTQDFSHIETSARNFKIYMQLAFFAGIPFFLHRCDEYYTVKDSDKYWIALYHVGFSLEFSILLIPILYIVLMNLLYLTPLKKHREWVEKNGFFKNINIKSRDDMDVDIIKSGKLRSYSVADELTKWAQLKVDGHISEEEYNEARRKLLKK